jgi:hypothetical protein
MSFDAGERQLRAGYSNPVGRMALNDPKDSKGTPVTVCTGAAAGADSAKITTEAATKTSTNDPMERANDGSACV